MLLNVKSCLMFLLFVHDTITDRRITDGSPVHESKRYMVYLIKAESSPQKYDSWLCGGAIVSPLFIVTSAACVEDVQHMYAIAGYNQYVKADKLDINSCTKEKKKKVIFTCVPKTYDFDYTKVEKWSFIDIAVVKVESPYDFDDKSYERLCTHIPDLVAINYDPKYQEPGTDAMVLGWGHKEMWRKPSDPVDYNQETLQYAAILIQDKEKCKQNYQHVHGMDGIIDKYMICTDKPGNIDDRGELIAKTKPTANGCIVTKLKGNTTELIEEFVECEDVKSEEVITEVDLTRRKLVDKGMKLNVTRRYGICQNDHGGPLVTWLGSHEVLVGVASVFRVNSDSKCEGPYLFTSTQCNGAFLDCVINEQSSTRRRTICNKPPKERGFHIVRRKISWANHPDGLAENEKVQIRPQLPLRSYE